MFSTKSLNQLEKWHYSEGTLREKDPVSFSTFAKMTDQFANLGCTELLVKPLSLHQDNEKNQIYLGSSSNELMSILPGQQNFRNASSSTLKRKSNTKSLIIETALKFSWINEGSEPSLAPFTKIIDYFQYPEIRLSGFLRGCTNPPDALRRERQSRYGRRCLVIGISGDQIFATVITDSTPTIIDKLLSLPKWQPYDLFHVLALSNSAPPLIDPTKLLAEIRAITGKKHDGCSLKTLGGTPEPYLAVNGGGYTLEALLGIPRNSSGAPDKYGFEIKSFSTNRITLMTPEPDFGYRHDQGLTAFLMKFGWKGTKNDGSYRFNGKHNTLGIYPKSKLELKILNWDSITNSPDGNGSPDIVLINPNTDEIAAGWTFSKLSASWGRKHAGGIYVQSTRSQPVNAARPPRYTFGPTVHCGLGTSPLYLMKAIGTGNVYLDPGDRVNSAGEEKKRTQWRIEKPRGVTLGDALSILYDQMTTYQL